MRASSEAPQTEDNTRSDGQSAQTVPEQVQVVQAREVLREFEREAIRAVSIKAHECHLLASNDSIVLVQMVWGRHCCAPRLRAIVVKTMQTPSEERFCKYD